MNIISFEKEHIGAVYELEKMCFSSPISEKNLETILIDGIGKGFVCVDDESNCVVAYGGVMIAADEAQILNIATHPDFRGQGLGKAIVRAILDYSKLSGASVVSLEVRESNLVAIRLYESFGFFEVGRIKKYYKAPDEDALIMKKEF